MEPTLPSLNNKQKADMREGGPYYRPVGKEVEIFEHCYTKRLPLLLKGPTGTGKSRLVEYMAHRLGLELVSVVCHEETSAVDLLGRYLVQGAATVWQDGPLTRAVRNGAMFYLDEIAEARPDTVVALHSLLDHRRELFIERHAETLGAPESFMLVASFNPGYQRGMKELKPSTRQRFVSLSFTYPEADLETEIIAAESGAEKALCRKLCGIAAKLRALEELGMSESVSTRLLVDAAKLITGGIAPRLACSVAIVEPLSDDADTIAALNDIIALVF